MAQEKTVELILKSPLVDETIEVPAELWARFEQRAKELEIPVEELFPMALDILIKSPDVDKKIAEYLEGGSE